MAAYFLVDIRVTDPAEYETYKQQTPATLEPFGGRFIVRGSPVECLEGEWPVSRLVILEFPDMERAKAWYHSDVYEQAKQIRLRSAQTRMILVDGFL